MPMPTQPTTQTMSQLRMAEFNYDKESLQEEVEEMLPMANPNQKDIFDEVMTAIENDSPIAKAFFIQSAGGCGKTFTLNLLLKSIRLQGKIAIAVASSGIAGLLLEGGSTAHSRFAIPIVLEEKSRIKLGSEKATIIRDSAIIIWDEAPMANKDNFRVVDELLRDIMKDVDARVSPLWWQGVHCLRGLASDSASSS